jgi:hypothetical protein
MPFITKDHSSQNDFIINIRKDNPLWLGINKYSIRIEETADGLTVKIYDWNSNEPLLATASTKGESA